MLAESGCGSEGVTGAPWVLVAGSFHTRGGMDKANAAFASYLLDVGAEVHLVAHHVDRGLAEHSGARVHLVPRPAGSFFLAGPALARTGRSVAQRVTRAHPRTRVVANGGNCAWPGVNWVHSVHAAWPCADEGAPGWFRAKNRLVKARARRDERRALAGARLVVANSERTRRDVVERIGVDSARVHTVYLGADPEFGPVSPEERWRTRASFGVPEGRRVVVFVGALSYDNNKGLDVLWRAWQALSQRPDWNADLVVAGGGNALPEWRARIEQAGLGAPVRMLGFTERVPELMAASDLLVSPARYEAYGLNVQEALCRGVPVLASSHAGVVERFPRALDDMVLDDPEDAYALVARLERWHADVPGWAARADAFGRELRAYTWRDMASRMLDVIMTPSLVTAPTPSGVSAAHSGVDTTGLSVAELAHAR